MYRITAQRTIKADPTTIWCLITNVDRWPTWAPHAEAADLDGEFTAGGTGWSKPRGGASTTCTITEVAERRSWSSECALPGGKLSGRTEITDQGTMRCSKTIAVHGPLVSLFRRWFGKRIQADPHHTFAAPEFAAPGFATLETEAGKVAA